jgi:stage V sporulation protein G
VEITEVKVKLLNGKSARTERLRAFCSMTINNSFVIRDLKIIEGAKGAFVAMPSRKLTDRCPKCGGKNHLRARFCNDCGEKLAENRAKKDAQGRAKLHADVAHPINSQCRETVQTRVLEAYNEELERSKQPGYVSAYEEGEDTSDYESETPSPEPEEEEKPEEQQEEGGFGSGLFT